MKKAILLITLAIGIIACGEKKTKEKTYKFQMCLFGVGTATYINCDSFQMITSKKAYVWVDGIKMSVEAERVLTPATY
jgi:hypothetical protein